MERRDAIKNIGWSFGAFIATPTALGFLQSCGPSMEPWTPSFLSDIHGQVLRKVVDGIIPGIDDLPSATNANVHVFIDKYLDMVMPLEDRDSMVKGLDTLMARLLEDAGEDSVEDISSEQIDSFLSNNLSQSPEQQDAFDKRVGDLFESGAEPDDFPDDIKVGMLLSSLRGFSVWAYKNSEIVGKNILAYDPVPGEYIGCGDLQELSGGRVWSE